MAKNNALIAFYFRRNPKKMSDNEWCKSVEEINWVLKYTGVLQQKVEQ